MKISLKVIYFFMLASMLNGCLGCLENIMPDPGESPECQELYLKRFAAKRESRAANEAYRDYLDQPLASPEDEYALSLLSEAAEAFDVLNDIEREYKNANCK